MHTRLDKEFYLTERPFYGIIKVMVIFSHATAKKKARRIRGELVKLHKEVVYGIYFDYLRF